jgi:hypothetical protein
MKSVDHDVLLASNAKLQLDSVVQCIALETMRQNRERLLGSECGLDKQWLWYLDAKLSFSKASPQLP